MATKCNLQDLLNTGNVVAGTGHRPDKLGGYDQATSRRLQDLAEAALRRYAPTAVISGMALGWDQALAEAALVMDIPLIAAVPFVGQEKRWAPDAQKRYHEILACAAVVHVVSPGGYSHLAMHARNQWMVDRCKHLLALWDGTSGGTANCLNYAVDSKAQVTNLWSSWIKFR